MGRSTKRSTKQEFIKKSIKVHGEKYDYSLVEYKNNKTKVNLICKKHEHTFSIRPDAHISQKQGCGECKKDVLSELKKFTTKSFIKMSKDIHGEKYDYSLVEYLGTDIMVDIICPKHGIFKKTPHAHIGAKQQGCAECSKLRVADMARKSTEDFISESNYIHNNRYDYSKTEYINNKKKVIITCRIHGDFKIKPNTHLSQCCGCPKCKVSRGELEIMKILDNNNINYLYEYKFDGCFHINPLRFDFYLPDYNTCIEYDGEYHYIPHWSDDGSDSLLNIKKRDNIKNDYCEKNGIRLIRIPFFEYDNIGRILSEFV